MGSEMNCGRKYWIAILLILGIVFGFRSVHVVDAQELPQFLQDIISACDPSVNTFCQNLSNIINEGDEECLKIVRGFLPEDKRTPDGIQDAFLNRIDVNKLIWENRDGINTYKRDRIRWKILSQFQRGPEQEYWYIIDIYSRCLRDYYPNYFSVEDWASGVAYRYFVVEIAKKIDELHPDAKAYDNLDPVLKASSPLQSPRAGEIPEIKITPIDQDSNFKLGNLGSESSTSVYNPPAEPTEQRFLTAIAVRDSSDTPEDPQSVTDMTQSVSPESLATSQVTAPETQPLVEIKTAQSTSTAYFAIEQTIIQSKTATESGVSFVAGAIGSEDTHMSDSKLEEATSMDLLTTQIPTMTHAIIITPRPTNTITSVPPTKTAILPTRYPTVIPVETSANATPDPPGPPEPLLVLLLFIGAGFLSVLSAWLFLKRLKRRASRPARRRPVSSAAPGAQPQERRTLRLEDWITADPKTMEIGSMSSFLNFSFGNMQHQGRRDYQEDSFGFSDISDPELVAKRGILAIVADGMGGLKNGKSISERAIQKFRKSFVKFSPSGDIPRQMLALVMETNHDIYETDKQKGGTTLLCVYIYRNSMYWVSVGDSAIYLFRKGRIYQLNKEHNRLNDLYLRFMYREITREQLMAEPSLQGLTANIGRRELREVDRNLTELKLQSGDRLLLCTDGVSGRLTEKELLVAMSQRGAQACADALKRMILKKNAPKQDNFTAEVIFCD